MIKINIPKDLPEEIKSWEEKAKEITKEIINEPDLIQKRTLIEKYKNHWRNKDLINWLSKLGHDKCWYTETKFGGDYQEIEHFRPKKEVKKVDPTDNSHPGYYWLAFDLSNYRLSKIRPNRKKNSFFPIKNERYRANCESDPWEDEFPLLLDPIDEEDCQLLSFDDNGKPVSLDGIDEVECERVKYSIEKYHLDERILNRRRKETWDTCRALYRQYLNTAKEANEKGSIVLKANAKSDLNRLKKLLRPEMEFSSVARAALIKLGEDIATSIVARS